MAESDKFRGRIIAVLRRLSFSWPARNQCKAEAKVAPATFKCKSCEVWIYEGASKENYEKICAQTTSRVIMERIVLDHILPVVSPSLGFTTWDDYINRMFCDKYGYQVLCQSCSNLKTKDEQELRKQSKKKRKSK